MVKKLKVDTQQLKQLLREKVEFVGLGVACFLTVLFLGMGLVAAFGARSPDVKITADALALKKKIADAEPLTEAVPEAGKDPAVVKVDSGGKWPLGLPGDRFPAVTWFDASGAGEVKKRNPPILPIDVVDRAGNVKFVQLDALEVPVPMYQVTRDQKIDVLKTPDGKNLPAYALRTQRLVVVNATFPYKEQMDLYRKALRIEKAEELTEKGLAPKLAGLNVYRRVILSEDKATEWEPVYAAEKDGKVTARKPIHDLLTRCAYDESMLQQYGQLMPGTANTPLPRPAHGGYPKLQLEGIVAREVEGAKSEDGPPMKGGPGGFNLPGGAEKEKKDPGAMVANLPPALPPWQLPLKILPRAFRERLSGKVNYFNPFGAFPDEEGAKDDGAGKQGILGMAPKGSMFPGMMKGGKLPGMQPMGKEGEGEKGGEAGTSGMSENGKVLVRFVDADVQPGVTYQYFVQVRMANPNYGKTSEVAYDSLAEQKELLSPGALTPTVTIPGEFHFYLVDQHPLETKVRGQRTTIDYAPREVPADKVPVQIHKWVRQVIAGDEYQVNNWVIAERLLLTRGETIGRQGVEVEVPVWDIFRNAFVLGAMGNVGKGKAVPRAAVKTALPIDFGPDDGRPPVLADFTRGTARFEDGNTEALIVEPDGSLVVRNSREDSDPASEVGKDRVQRYDTWRNRIRSLRGAQ